MNKPKEAKEEKKTETEVKDKIVPVQKPLANMIRCDPTDPDIEYIKTYYGLSDDFPLDQIFTYSENMNKLLILNKGLSDYLYADQEKQITIVAGGAETFLRNSNKNFGGLECIYRISQNGVYHIYPFMTKRIFNIDLETFKFFLYNRKIEVTEIAESPFKDDMLNLSCGCFVVVTKINETQEEALVLHRHHKHINTMISDLNLHKIITCLAEN